MHSPNSAYSASAKISSVINNLDDIGKALPNGDTAPVKVPRADSDRTPSQNGPGAPIKRENNSHLSTRLPNTKIRLSNDATVLLDAEDGARLGDERWYLLTTKQGKRYAVAHGECGKLLYLHREVLGAVGRQQVDHKNGDTLDCRRSNLRVATPGQNRANSRKRRGSASQYKGVYPSGSRWLARIKLVRLGSFPTEIEAARAYDSAARAEFGEFARLNFPGDAA